MNPTAPTFFMPEGVSTFAPSVDGLYYFVYWISVFFFGLIVMLMTVFIVRYRRRSELDKTPNITHNTVLEVGWTVIPMLLLIVMFFLGFDRYMELRIPPHPAMEIQVTAQQWRWTFTYPDGTVVQSDLAVPIDEPVRMIMTSKDVIHSFFIPQFRQKQDVIPNRYTTTWFQANKLGDYDLFCAEYCGAQHSAMLGKVHVMKRDKLTEWLSTGGLGDISKLPLAEQGKIIYRSFQCITCHTVDGSPLTGPTFKGIFGHTVKLADGRTVTVDENYIRKSIMEPASDVVAGFFPVMPIFKGQIKDQQITAVIAYIKSLQ